MNPYELADELKKCVDDGFTDLVCVCDAVNMLRQQADRIAELEKSHIELERGIVADLNQRQSAEPFIWLKQDFDGEWIEVHPNKGIPLYTTHQIKELSDEENNLKWWISSFEHLKTLGGGISDEMEAKLKEMKKRLKKRVRNDHIYYR